MASSILPSPTSRQLNPLIPTLANMPSAEADALMAARYCRNESGVWRGLGGIDFDTPSGKLFWFACEGGSVDCFTEAELRSQTWWYWLPEQIARSIEAHLFPMPERDRPVSYVARAEPGGKLIRHSRLTEYFHGEPGRDRAYEERDRLRQDGFTDAAVFHAESVEEADFLLSTEDGGTVLIDRRMAEARAARFAEGAAAMQLPAAS